MTEDASLKDYLIGERANGGPCFCKTAPKAVVEQVDAVIVGGSRQWTAMVRWLDEQGVKTSKTKLAEHHVLGHHLKR